MSTSAATEQNASRMGGQSWWNWSRWQSRYRGRWTTVYSHAAPLRSTLYFDVLTRRSTVTFLPRPKLHGFHCRLQKRSCPGDREPALSDGVFPAREARERRSVRPHEAEEHPHGRCHRPHLQCRG